MKQGSFLKEENQILRGKLKQAHQLIAELRQQLEIKNTEIKFLENELKANRSVDTKVEGIVQSVYYRQDSVRNGTPTTPYNNLIEDQPLTTSVELKQSNGSNLSFDSSIFDEHRPLNVDFRMPKFQKSHLFRQVNNLCEIDIPVSPVTHTRGAQSKFHQADKIRRQMSFDGRNELFKVFLITGVRGIQPMIQYSYPGETDVGLGLLELLYPENILRLKERTKSLTEIKKIIACSPIKDLFIIALKQPEIPHNKILNDQHQYAIGCQVEEVVFRDDSYYVYSRYFCFVSDYKCIKLFIEILTQIISIALVSVENVQTQKQFYVCESHDDDSRLESSLTQNTYTSYFKQFLERKIQPLLQRLLKNKFEYNQHLRVKLSSQKTIMEEIPARDSESQLVYGYSNIILLHNCKVQYSMSGQKPYDQNMITFLTVYFVCEQRVVLYSQSKEKVSIIILLLLELIKPLHFVNPILQGCIKQAYSEFFEAPMSIVLGLWLEKKSQKLELSTKKSITKKPPGPGQKQTLAELLERDKLAVQEGIVVNLDLQKAYGNLDSELNFIASWLTRQLARSGQKAEGRSRFLNTLLQKTYANEINAEWATRLKQRLKQTQLYSYYTQTAEQPKP